MSLRLPTFLPRLAALVLVALAATAGLTLAAGSQVPSAPAVPTVDTAPPALPLVVPDVRNQAFVFAKGALADDGFAWRVSGSVQGYAANIVTGQSPRPGTRLIDTGSPLITLTLKRNSSYKELGEPADKSPYPATLVQPSDLSGNPIGPVAPVETSAPGAKTKTAKKVATTPAPAATAPATTATTPAKAATTPAKTSTPPTPAKTAKSTAAATWPKTRPAAFDVPGARKEPLDEMPLPDRAKALVTWLDTHQTKSPAAAKYWLYQNEWIVTGATMGWWHGAEALQTLIAVDQRTQSLWGIGAKSASAAQQALDQVRAKAKS